MYIEFTKLSLQSQQKSHSAHMNKQRPYNDRFDENTQTLMLQSCNVRDMGIVNLLEADWTLLRKLDISNNMLTDASLEHFAKFVWDNLVSFHLNKNQFTNKGIVTLMKVKFPALKSLWLNSQKDLGDEAIIAIANGELPKLETLWLTFNHITAKGLEHFVKRNWDNLKKLNLSVNHFGPKGAEALAKGSFAGLLRLQIYDCGLGDEGVKNLMKNQWPNVQELHLSNNGIGDEGISYLVQRPWKNLDFLHLSTNPFGQQGARAILGHQWPAMKRIKMKRTKKIPEQLKQKLRTKFFPKAELSLDV